MCVLKKCEKKKKQKNKIVKVGDVKLHKKNCIYTNAGQWQSAVLSSAM